MCNLKTDTSKCNYDYEPDQLCIKFNCPICKDGTVMTPIFEINNMDDLTFTFQKKDYDILDHVVTEEK